MGAKSIFHIQAIIQAYNGTMISLSENKYIMENGITMLDNNLIGCALIQMFHEWIFSLVQHNIGFLFHCIDNE